MWFVVSLKGKLIWSSASQEFKGWRVLEVKIIEWGFALEMLLKISEGSRHHKLKLDCKS